MFAIISCLQLVAILLAAVSTRYFLVAAKVSLPEAPKAGDLVSAGYFQEVRNSMQRMAEWNKKACFWLTFAIALQGVTWLLGFGYGNCS